MSGSQKVEPSDDQMAAWEFKDLGYIHNHSTFITYSAMFCVCVKPRNRGTPGCQMGRTSLIVMVLTRS